MEQRGLIVSGIRSYESLDRRIVYIPFRLRHIDPKLPKGEVRRLPDGIVGNNCSTLSDWVEGHQAVLGRIREKLPERFDGLLPGVLAEMESGAGSDRGVF